MYFMKYLVIYHFANLHGKMIPEGTINTYLTDYAKEKTIINTYVHNNY